VRILRNVHGPWHLLLTHHWVAAYELSILALNSAHIGHPSSGELKHRLIETLHVHHIREPLRHRLKVVLHIRHAWHLQPVAKVIIRNLPDIHITELIDVILSSLVDMTYLPRHLP